MKYQGKVGIWQTCQTVQEATAEICLEGTEATRVINWLKKKTGNLEKLLETKHEQSEDCVTPGATDMGSPPLNL